MSVLAGNTDNTMLRVNNNADGANATALDLQVEPGKAPMKVNSQSKAALLDADKLDGQSSAQLEPLIAAVGPGGGLSGGKGAVSATKESTGVYTMDFGRPVSGCARAAGLGRELNAVISPTIAATSVPGGEASTFDSTVGGICVVTRDSAGDVVEESFHPAVYC